MGGPGGIENQLAAVRRKRGMPASRLAELAGVRRQTIYAMEAGAYVPNTAVALRLSRALEVGVEELFHLQGEPAAAPARTETVRLLPGTEKARRGQPVQLCRVGRATIASVPAPLAWYLPVADAVIDQPGPAARVQLFQGDEELGSRVLMAGCDPAVSVLARHVQRAGVDLVVAQRNSSQALDLLRQRLVHIAGSHLRDDASGESNLPAIRHLFPRGSVAVISFAVWEEGLLVERGNPKRIHTVRDLAAPEVQIVNREPGAGSRLLLDSELERAAIAPRRVRGYDRIAQGHLAAAWRVASGQADCCVATRAAARMFGLDFISLVSERYDLVMRRRTLDFPPVQRLLDALSLAGFRRELEGVGGYDTTVSGRRQL